MQRKAIGTTLVLAGLLAGSFLAGALVFSGGGSGATGSPAVDTAALVTPTPTATRTATATPTATAIKTPDIQGAQEQTGGLEGSLTSISSAVQSSGDGGGTPGQTHGPSAPVAPAVPPVLPPVEQPAPQQPEVAPPIEPVPPVAEPEPPVEQPEPPASVDEAPYIIEFSPADGETGVGLKPVVSVTFSEPMDEASTEAAFSISPPVLGAFAWEDDGRVLKFTPDVAFDYSTKVEWQVASSATDEAGLAMTSGQASSFLVLRQKTMTLYSQPARDGFVYAPGAGALDHVVTEGFNGHNSLLVGTWTRGFLSFDLADLPAEAVDITAAELVIHQRAHHAQAYTGTTGALWIVSLPYGDLDIGDFATPTPTVCPNLCYPLGFELSSSAADGWKTVEVTPLVRADWKAGVANLESLVGPGGPERLSQFRLQFLNENNGAGPNVWAEFHAGEAGGSAAKLSVTYVY